MEIYIKIKCMLGKHSVSEDARRELKDNNSGKVTTNCVICGKNLILTKHPIAPNAFFIDVI